MIDDAVYYRTANSIGRDTVRDISTSSSGDFSMQVFAKLWQELTAGENDSESALEEWKRALKRRELTGRVNRVRDGS